MALAQWPLTGYGSGKSGRLGSTREHACFSCDGPRTIIRDEFQAKGMNIRVPDKQQGGKSI